MILDIFDDFKNQIKSILVTIPSYLLSTIILLFNNLF